MILKSILKVVAVVILIISLATLLFAGCEKLVEVTEPIEVETYTVGAEISHLDQDTYYQRGWGKKTDYRMSVRNDDFSTQFEITAEQYAKYRVNEIVEVEVTVWENPKGTETWETYKLIK